MNHVHIFAPAPIERTVKWITCLDCKKRSAFAILYFEWFGPSMTCMRCGRDYEDMIMCRAPFERAWRKKNKDGMRKRWKALKPQPTPESERVG